MNFAEWTEKKRKETGVSFLPEQRVSFGEWSARQTQSVGGSFGVRSSGTPRSTGGRSGGIVSTPTTATDYTGEMARLQEQRRRAAVDMDMDTVNAADNAMKALRAQTGRQTLGDRIGDVVGAAAAGTVGSAAASVLTEKLGNTGLFKSTYGRGLLDDETLGTLGRLALSSAAEWT